MAPPRVAIGPAPTAAPTAAPVPAPTISACEAQPARPTKLAASTIAILDFIVCSPQRKLKRTESIEAGIAGSRAAGMLRLQPRPRFLVGNQPLGPSGGNGVGGRGLLSGGVNPLQFSRPEPVLGHPGADVGLHATVAVDFAGVLAN